METLEPTTGMTAEELINTAVEENNSGTAILDDLGRRKEELSEEEQALIDHYRSEMQSVMTSMEVEDLGGNTAGLYDGSTISIDRNVLKIGDSIDTTIDQAQEVEEHEKYHQKHVHTAPMQIIGGTRGDIAVVIGGKEFSETELIEGLTVSKTGDRFVSGDYVRFKENLEGAVGSAGLSMGEIENAVNEKKDLTQIDDRAREEVPDYAVAA